jgi:hypothetical protein
MLSLAIAPSAMAQRAADQAEVLSKMPEEEEAAANISGTLSFDGNTNFMLYGYDVWGTGTFDDVILNPSLSLTWDLGDEWNVHFGTWMDVNNNQPSPIGGPNFGVQEMDVWLGLGKTFGKVSTGVTYQEWLYGGDSERVLDVAIGYDTLFSPSLVIHSRIHGNSGTSNDGTRPQNLGSVFVLGAKWDSELGPVSLSTPVAVAFVTNNFNSRNSTDPDAGFNAGGGFGYVSLGLQTSTALTFLPAVGGDWTLNVGGTYYYSDPDNVGNADDNIFTMNFGLAMDF